MNLKLVVLLVCFGMLSFVAKAEFREFTDAKGRTITAKLISYNALQEKVTLKLKGKGNKTVPIGIFSETDQQYIVSWHRNRDFLSDKKLKAEFTRQKKITDASWSTGWRDVKSYDCHFDIELANRSTMDFNNVEFEYVVFYSQDHDRRQWTDKEERHGTLYAKKKIDLPAKSTTEFTTEKIIMWRHKFGSSSQGVKDLEYEVHGIMLKLSMKTETGETISRRIVFPNNLEHVWTPRTQDAQWYPPE